MNQNTTPSAPPALGLTARAVNAARHARDADHDGFANRHQDWHTWPRRARLGRTLAVTLEVPLEPPQVVSPYSRQSRSHGGLVKGCRDWCRSFSLHVESPDTSVGLTVSLNQRNR